jgi:hypothetical protein
VRVPARVSETLVRVRAQQRMCTARAWLSAHLRCVYASAPFIRKAGHSRGSNLWSSTPARRATVGAVVPQISADAHARAHVGPPRTSGHAARRGAKRGRLWRLRSSRDWQVGRAKQDEHDRQHNPCAHGTHANAARPGGVHVSRRRYTPRAARVHEKGGGGGGEVGED